MRSRPQVADRDLGLITECAADSRDLFAERQALALEDLAGRATASESRLSTCADERRGRSGAPGSRRG